MKINVLTLFPEIFVNALNYGMPMQAQKKELIRFEFYQLRDFSKDPHRRVDDRPFGGGDGMVLRPDIVADAIETIAPPSSGTSLVINMSPQGQVLNEVLIQKLAQFDQLSFLCGRYAGIDQRVLNQKIDLEISIGDYVLSGGDFAALVVIDAIVRKIPGVLGHPLSAESDSFSQGRCLEGPSFTRPQLWSGEEVPEVLLQGDHEKILHWRKNIAELTTLYRRPDLTLSWPISKLEALEHFWNSLSPEVRESCGLSQMKSSDFLK